MQPDCRVMASGSQQIKKQGRETKRREHAGSMSTPFLALDKMQPHAQCTVLRPFSRALSCGKKSTVARGRAADGGNTGATVEMQRQQHSRQKCLQAPRAPWSAFLDEG
jgi:hypothetical protein